MDAILTTLNEILMRPLVQIVIIIIFIVVEELLRKGLFLTDKFKGWFKKKEYYSFNRVEKAVNTLSQEIINLQIDGRNFMPRYIFAIAGDTTFGGAIFSGLLGNKLNLEVRYLEIDRKNKRNFSTYKKENRKMIVEHLKFTKFKPSIIVADDVSRSGDTLRMVIEIINESYKDNQKPIPYIGVVFIGIRCNFPIRIKENKEFKQIYEIYKKDMVFYNKTTNKNFLFPWKN